MTQRLTDWAQPAAHLSEKCKKELYTLLPSHCHNGRFHDPDKMMAYVTKEVEDKLAIYVGMTAAPPLQQQEWQRTLTSVRKQLNRLLEPEYRRLVWEVGEKRRLWDHFQFLLRQAEKEPITDSQDAMHLTEAVHRGSVDDMLTEMIRSASPRYDALTAAIRPEYLARIKKMFPPGEANVVGSSDELHRFYVVQYFNGLVAMAMDPPFNPPDPNVRKEIKDIARAINAVLRDGADLTYISLIARELFVRLLAPVFRTVTNQEATDTPNGLFDHFVGRILADVSGTEIQSHARLIRKAMSLTSA